jgi:glycerol uptake facilitator-like aquaporin
MIRKLFAEFLGSMILVVAAISPVILAVEVLGASIALAVLIDALAVAFILAVLIETLGPVSSAHFNPAVTFAMMISGNMRTAAGLAYMAAQLTGGFADTIAAHAMYFERDFFMLIAVSDIPRTGGAYVGEFIGSFMLLLVIFALMSRNTRFDGIIIGLLVGGFLITASSTMFANPQVTFARIFTWSAAGVRPADALVFIAVQFGAAALATVVSRFLFGSAAETNHPA